MFQISATATLVTSQMSHPPKDRTVVAGIAALEEQLAVSADLHRTCRHAGDIGSERDRVSMLAALEREQREITNALRILRTHAVMDGALMA